MEQDFYWIRSLAIPISATSYPGNRLVDREDRKSTAQRQSRGRFPGERGSRAQAGEAFGGNCFAAYGNVYGIDPGGSICTLSEDRHGGGGGHDLSDPGGKVSAGGERKVWKHLKAGNPEAAREAVSMIVGRDTQNLTEEGVAKAAIETVAENTSDGVIAPMLYTALGGPVLGFLYKAVNTMDSMVGYKNDRYLHFGRAAAKLDDVVNFSRRGSAHF